MKWLSMAIIGLSLLAQAQDKQVDILKDVFKYDSQTKHTVAPEKLISGCPSPDCIPSIDKPDFMEAASASFMKDKEGVLGITYKGVSKAYPISILTYHEVVNDTIAGDPILISFCPLCSSGVAFKRTINGEPVEFGVSGVLYNSQLVLYDRNTSSLWDQLDGSAIMGPLTGDMLDIIPAAQTSWGNWKAQHPETLVLTRKTGFRRNYGQNPYGDYGKSPTIRFPVDHMSKTFHPKTWVYGFEVDGKAIALNSHWLKEEKQSKVKVAGRKFEVVYHDDGLVTFKDVKSGEVFPSTRLYWFAWYARHPKTKVEGASKMNLSRVDDGRTKKQRRPIRY